MIDDAPRVATVLLVAVGSRQRVLASSLRVIGEPVTYTVEAIEPNRVATTLSSEPRRWPSDVILIDGESVAEDHEREDLLRTAYLQADRLSTVLYIPTRLPSEEEAELSLVWADDSVLPGWQFGDRLRRHVQAIALAPWRRSMALRVEAERRGDRCLRLIRPRVAPTLGEPRAEPAMQAFAAPGPERGLPASVRARLEALAERGGDLVADAFHEGRRAGIAHLAEEAERVALRLANERAISIAALTPQHAAEVEALFHAVSERLSPVAAARYLGAVTALEALRIELQAIVRSEATSGSCREPRSARREES